ncbi:MAG: sodium:solute symporter [Cyanobacteria bacterium SZAS LIN-3]|nr:sodium:solute symporter [Cyanobacteria bacterium SZAS LIN-3]
MNWLDFVVLFSSIVSIAAYSIWRTRHRDSLHSYVKGSGQTPWFAIGLSVMATQASAITFLSTPGQGYLNGLSFIQIYFGVPIALLVISIFFLPIFSHLHVYTAYEFLEKRFDAKTRLLGAGLFLLQRGLGAGLTIYAPAIVLTTVFGWPLDLTIISSGLLVILYTVTGGSDAVTMTQKYQLGIIFAGMVTAACVLVSKLPSGLDLSGTLALAGGFHRLNAVNFSTDIHERYTIWSGLLGGTFLMLSYFGTDQSQVQRYISGSSLRESRLGLLFNAICKIPMQFCILSIGVLIFVFYQFQPPPLFFDSTANKYLAQHQDEPKLIAYKDEFARGHELSKEHLVDWLKARQQGDDTGARTAFAQALAAQKTNDEIRQAAQAELRIKTPLAKANDADYVFITFILQQLPHGAIGLLIAAFFAAALSSKAAELNALGVSTSIDFYRLLQPKANDFDCLRVTKWATAGWGLIAIGFALFAHLSENLIQAVNILGSIFYGVMLGIFLAAFFIKRIGGTAIFWAALTAQMLVFVLYFTQTISYLWYPLIGCAACIVIGLILQGTIGKESATKGNTQ